MASLIIHNCVEHLSSGFRALSVWILSITRQGEKTDLGTRHLKLFGYVVLICPNLRGRG